MLRQRRVFQDIDALTEAVKDWDLDFRQLSCGPFFGELRQYLFEEGIHLSYVFFNQDIEQHGMTPVHMKSFAVFSSSDQSLDWRGRRCTGNDMLIHHDDLECVSPSGFRMFVASFTEELLHAVAEQSGAQNALKSLRDDAPVRCDDTCLTVLRDALGTLIIKAPLEPDETYMDMLRYELPAAILSTLSEQEKPGKKPPPYVRSSALKKALSYIDECEQEAITIKALCEASGASERTLRYAFLDRFGLPPKAYLTARRLNGVRKSLRISESQSTTVGAVAAQWGFCHLSQFAADYKNQFGELPSTTLRKT